MSRIEYSNILIVASRTIHNFRVLDPISFQHMSLWVPLLNSHPSIHHSNIGICISVDVYLDFCVYTLVKPKEEDDVWLVLAIV
jgi:hypothetical protein